MHEGVLLAYIGACLQIIKTMTRSCGVVSAWTSTFRARPPWRPPALWPGRRATRLTHTAGLRPGTAGSRFPPALAAATVRVTITAGALAFQAHLKRKRCVCPRESRAREQTAESSAQGATCSVRSGMHLLQLHLQLEAWSNADSTISLKSGYEEWVQIQII